MGDVPPRQEVTEHIRSVVSDTAWMTTEAEKERHLIRGPVREQEDPRHDPSHARDIADVRQRIGGLTGR